MSVEQQQPQLHVVLPRRSHEQHHLFTSAASFVFRWLTITQLVVCHQPVGYMTSCLTNQCPFDDKNKPNMVDG